MILCTKSEPKQSKKEHEIQPHSETDLNDRWKKLSTIYTQLTILLTTCKNSWKRR